MNAALLVDRAADPRAIAGQNHPQIGKLRVGDVAQRDRTATAQSGGLRTRTNCINLLFTFDNERGCFREMMKRTDTIAYCQREAARLQSVCLRTTTTAIKARLAEQIEALDRIANGDNPEPPDLELTIARSRW